MAKGSNNVSGRRSHGGKPYDPNNSFVKKVATKVTDLIPQRSWISKWFNSSEDNGEVLNNSVNAECEESTEEVQQAPPAKRPRIRMDVIHPPGTFNIQLRNKSSLNKVDETKDFSNHDETNEDFLEPLAAGPSGLRRLVSSTPAVQNDVRNTVAQRSNLNSLNPTQDNGVINEADDNSESSESTSGCSSLIPQNNRQEAPSNTSFAASFTNKKRFMDDNKMNYTNHLQSPRSLFLDTSNRDSLSSRRPSFNSSIMSNNLERSSTLASPFYSGNVTFGGANAAGLYKRTRSLFNSNNEYKLKVPRRTNVQVKPFNNGNIDSSGMSQTAKRILDALEHFSSPVLDAKKIPIKNTTNLTNSGGMKRPREEVVTSPRVGLRHRTQQLMVPTVPDLLKIRRRQRLQDTTLAARNIVSAHSAPPITTPSEYRIRTDADDDLKFRGKLRVKSKTNPMDEETLEPVNLPTIALPISTLPRFDIALPQYTKPADRSIDKDDSFKFASPIKVTSTTKSLSSVTDFTFSNPINPNAKQIAPSELNSSSRTLSIESNDSFLGTGSATNFMWSGSTAPRPKEKASFKESMPTATVELKSGSVVDFLKELNNKKEEEEEVTTKDGEKENEVEIINSKMDSWECSECLIRNESTTHCTACKSSKPGIKAKEPPRVSTTNVSQLKPIENDCFGSQFKLSSDQWECSSCLVRNKQSAEKCVSCMSAKPGAAAKIKSGVESDLLKKFKPASDSWECSGCMVRNNGNVTTCPCCSTAKPGQKQEPLKSFDGFKQSSSTWECPCCMVRNADNVTTCPCCKAVKPGSAKKPEETPKTSALGFGDKFKTPAGSWSCDACLVSNKADATECIACTTAKPGTEKTTPASSGSTLQFSFGAPAKESSFKFGIDKPDVTEPANSNSTGFTFGMKPATTSTEKFTFGIPSTSETTTTTTGFTFGNSNKTTDDSVAVTSDKPTFSFGIPKAEEKKKEQTVESTEKKDTFTFGGSETKTTPSGTTGGFKFGSPATKRPADNDDDSKIKKTIFGETNSFTAVVTSSQPSSTPSFSFTSSPAVSAISPPSATAGTAATLAVTPATTTTAAATTTASLPQFGNATFTFSDQSKSTNFGIQSSTTLNTFSFGGSKPVEAAPAEKKPLLSFPTTAFGSPNISTPFGKTEQPPVFGNIEKKPLFTAPEKVLAFGEKETFGTPDKTITSGFGGSSTAPSLFPSTAPPPSFGASTTPSPFGSSATIFANNATTNNSFSSPSTTSVFSKPNESENSTASAAVAPAAPPPAASNLFTFGSSTPAASSGGFNFSAGGNSTTPAAAAKAPPPLFGFGAAANTTQAGNSFGGSTFSTSTTAPAQAGFSFNAPKAEAPPAFGQTVPPPAFGTTQQQQPQTSFSGAGTSNAGFNFGSAAPPSAATGGFNFGGMNQTSSPAPPSGGFNFNAPNSVSFNFTGGNQPTTFNATPKLPIPPNQRKIKTARRRMTPR